MYGPVPYATLLRWRAEGKLADSSRLRVEGTPQEGPFLTFAEVPAPAPEPPAAPEPEPESEPAAWEEPPAVGESATSLLSRAWELYRHGFWAVCPLALLMQLPVQVFNHFFPTPLQTNGEPPPWMHSGKAWALVALAVAVLVAGEAVLTAYYGALDRTGRASVREAFRALRGRLGALLWTQFLRACVLSSWILLVGVFITFARGSMGWLRPLAFALATVVAYPALLLAVRYLIVPQVVILEKWSGLFALRRAGDLVRFSGKDGLFSGGDLRLVAGIFPWFLALLIVGDVAQMAEKWPHGTLVSQALVYGGTALLAPFLVAYFTLYVFDARRRLRAKGLE